VAGKENAVSEYAVCVDAYMKPGKQSTDEIREPIFWPEKGSGYGLGGGLTFPVLRGEIVRRRDDSGTSLFLCRVGFSPDRLDGVLDVVLMATPDYVSLVKTLRMSRAP
jgi:hypothetical protein